MRWSKKDKQFLDDNKNTLTNDEMGKVLRRTSKAVSMALSQFGLQRNPLVVSKMKAPPGFGKDSNHWKGGAAASQARYYTAHKGRF